ncbi:hypothetical protein CDL15_Pgr014197 [Punica granatum]|uniref:Uncharacterized protein n=1 Tax=Punica granatum TaxID=22663 RepID=A0A218XDD9_PUNGR|nr:hypothetical protein CDL15_Pgr014197 [Punica granatum]
MARLREANCGFGRFKGAAENIKGLGRGNSQVECGERKGKLMGSDGEVIGSDRCKKEFEICGGGSFLKLGAVGLGVKPRLIVAKPRLGD